MTRLFLFLLTLLFSLSGPAMEENGDFGRSFFAAKSVKLGGAFESRGGLLRMGAYDTETGTLGLGKGGHFDGASEAGMSGISPATHRGITMFEKDGKVFWANDSMSLNKAVTEAEANAIQKSLEIQFGNQTVIRLRQIGDAFK